MKETEQIRVMIVDDHTVVRSGLATFLSVMPDLNMVAEAGGGEQAVQYCGLYHPDVVLMDLLMPGMDGIAAIRAIRQKYPKIHLIALTSYQEQELVQGALQAGATGYLMKNVSAQELASAIRSAHIGRMILSPEATQALVHAATQPMASNELTERERDVLRLMVEGLNNAEIAERLVVSLSTVKYHVSNIFSKLTVESRVAAVKTAIQQRLVD